MTAVINNLIIVGPQGSGKGTQAELLAKKLGIPHISTGGIFREIRAQETPLGKQVKGLIDNGKLVPDDIVNRIVADRLKRDDAKKGYILDGYPRKTPQAMFLENQSRVTRCILVDVSNRESIKRISARRICPECKANFNTIYIKPRKEGICDNCGSMLAIRDDDKPDAVKVRLKKYHDETEPVVKFFQKKGIVVKINGEQTIEKVFFDILKGLKIN